MPQAPLHEWEDPDPSDQDNADSFDRGTIDCPHCGEEIDEEATWCHACGELIVEKERPRVTTMLIIIAVLLSMAFVALLIHER